MIGNYDLNILLEKYGIDSKKVLKKNSNIFDKGVYSQIEITLKYLINELNINPKNIEKCPSILYKNIYEIENNYNFLVSKKNILNYNTETCLHILSTNSIELKKHIIMF